MKKTANYKHLSPKQADIDLFMDDVCTLAQTISELFGAEIAPAGAPGRGELYLGKHRLSAAIPGNPLKLYGKAVAAGALKQTVQGFSVGGIHLESSTTAVAPAVILNSYGKGKTLYLNAKQNISALRFIEGRDKGQKRCFSRA